jgi:UPF0716 protein FxsA
MVKWMIIGLLALPIAEIGVFVLVVAAIGFAWALGLLLATTCAGLLVLRWTGRGRMALFRSVSGGGISGIEAGIEANPSGFLLVLGAILLVLPGFISDAIGALLLIASLWNWRGPPFGGKRAQPRDGVIDLTSGEWQEVPDRQLKNQREEPDRR